MKKLLLIICAFCQISLLSSCSLIRGVNEGIAIVKGVNDGKSVVKSKVEEIQREERLANQGVDISNGTTSSSSATNSTKKHNSQ